MIPLFEKISKGDNIAIQEYTKIDENMNRKGNHKQY